MRSVVSAGLVSLVCGMILTDGVIDEIEENADDVARHPDLSKRFSGTARYFLFLSD